VILSLRRYESCQNQDSVFTRPESILSFNTF